ncbi:MAG: signal recognition particle-docking protein FtsY [Actinomycetota bacterium]|nr:signal recognition particle-docking protein FtsY [Actinomycetota bacterium]
MELTYIVIALAVIALVAVLVIRSRRPGEPAATVTPTTAPPRGLRDRLAKTRKALSDRLGGVLSRSSFDGDFWSDVEDSLVAADVGVAAAAQVVAAVKARGPADPSAVRELLATELVSLLGSQDRAINLGAEPAVVLVVGVNGSGKTTTIAKLASQMNGSGTPVLLGAADTFRAAAAEQLKAWATRIGVDIVTGQSGADPASVAYDSYHAAKSRGAGVVLIDTAGRLHSKSNLMDELAKVARVMRREAGEIDEVLLVLDGTTGQNAIDQAKAFTAVVGVTGIVLTKLDGTARGGVAIAVEQGLAIPVKYIGVGEAVDDLIPFDPEAFVDALLGT